jgi:hypothetical protein
VLRSEIKQIQTRADQIRDDVFNARLGRPPPDDLIDEVNARAQSIRSLCADAHEAEQNARGALSLRRRFRLTAARR